MATITPFEPVLCPEEYISMVSERFISAADPLYAEKQMAYMRNQFEYCGLSAKVWYPMAKEILVQHGMYSGKRLREFVTLAYDQPYREVLYVGIEMMQRMILVQTKSWIRVLENCITTHSWWDTVDWLAKVVGVYFKQYPEQQHEFCYKWIQSENIWLQRTAIIHQLFYREETDKKLLFGLILYQADNKEFFIRKACGWALRQYSKTDPEAVRKFVNKNSLSPLTKKEALRLLATDE
jgi:3-methyladenine DNA glycosylase AlkD